MARKVWITGRLQVLISMLWELSGFAFARLCILSFHEFTTIHGFSIRVVNVKRVYFRVN